ncbi:hypothetical protein [Candidatus Protochlamydia naegleriophila]|nr:hypothetical protein [Candidatus Protochlamydia naegleriophila]
MFVTRFFIAILITIFSLSLEADEDKKALDNNKSDSSNLSGNQEAEQTIKAGNLSFPVSQQPTPLISFGQNVLNKKQAQLVVLTNEFKGKDNYFINIAPSLIYGLTDNLSVTLFGPLAVRYRQDEHRSSGPQDAIVQLEYAFYTKAYRTFYDQATIVANVSIPTGSVKKNPPTGFGANSFFIGGTYSRMKVDWFYFTSSGGILTTSSHRTKIGDQFLYQLGFGRRIMNSKEWLVAWMIEFNGIYSWKDRIIGEQNPDSGGNVILMTPSLFISSVESLVVQIGLGIPLVQKLNGRQNKTDYILNLNVSWTF